MKYTTTKSRIENKNLSIYLVRFGLLARIQDIISIQYLLNQRIEWEFTKKKDIIQCYRCKRFNHTAINCSMPPRCVKFREDHDPKQCPMNIYPVTGINIDEIEENNIRPPPGCVNCGKSGHPANFRSCPVYKKLENRRKNKIEKQKKEQPKEENKRKEKYYNNFINPNKSFASTVDAGIKNNSNTNIIIPLTQELPSNTNTTKNQQPAQLFNNAFSYINEECNNILGSDFCAIIDKIQKILPAYKNVIDIREKHTVLIQFMLSLIAP